MTGPKSLEAPNGYCFWVRLENAIFGHYLFRIDAVNIMGNEIVLQIKQIKRHDSTNINKSKVVQDIPQDWNEYFIQLKQSCSDNMLYFLTNVFTLTNILKVSTFCFVSLL